MQVVPRKNPDAETQRREVVLVDRRYDKHLAAMHAEAAQSVARARTSDGGGKAGRTSDDGGKAGPGPTSPRASVGAGEGVDRLAAFQALAHVVAGHMGGTLVRRHSC